MGELLTNCEVQVMRSGNQQATKHKWVLAGGYYFCICFVLSLRSPEGLMTDLEGLIHYFDREEEKQRHRAPTWAFQRRTPCKTTPVAEQGCDQFGNQCTAVDRAHRVGSSLKAKPGNRPSVYQSRRQAVHHVGHE